MKYLELDNIVIPYIIEVKKNKNTYFRFKKEGYIKINLSTYQTEKDAIKFIKKNKDKFIKNYQNIIKDSTTNDYYLQGIKYEKIQSEQFFLDKENNILYTNNSEQHKENLKQHEKSLMLKQLHSLKNKYQTNKLIDIKDITLNSRYTKTRHGSCNARKKSININLHLISYDPVYTEYVFLHEITHLKIQNHQKEFYDLLIKLCPNYKEIRKKLKEIYR